MLKRLFDIFASAFGLLFLLPLFVLLAVRIKRSSPGPVFYQGPRVGKDGKTFFIVKFRTMHENSESYKGPRVTAQGDPRITVIGKWLRDTKLNELPQLWNVLTGDMSMVGPRPEDPEIAKTWPTSIRKEILSVRPGITSPASVLFRDEERMLTTGRVMEEYLGSILPTKLRLDQLYVRHPHLYLYLDVIFWTLLILLPTLKNTSPVEDLLFWGPFSRFFTRYLSWFSVDTLVTFIAIGITGLLWRSIAPLDMGWPLAIGIGISFSLLFSLASAAMGVQRVNWSKAQAIEALDLLPPVLLAFSLALATDFALPIAASQPSNLQKALAVRPMVPPGLFLLASTLALFGFVIARYRTRLLSGLASRWVSVRGGMLATGERILIVGGGQAGQLAVLLTQTGSNARVFRVVGFVDDDLYKQGSRIRGIDVIGRRSDIPHLVEKYDIGAIIFAIHNIADQERQDLLNICTRTDARVVVIPDILSALTRSIKSSDNERKTELPNGDCLPCEYCLSQPSPLELDFWLAELSQKAQAGDLAAVQAQIKNMKEQNQMQHLWPEMVSRPVSRESLRENAGN